MPLKSKDKRTFIDSLIDCIHGFNFIVKAESNFKIECIMGILALILCFVLKVSTVEFIIILFVIFLVLICESINTAIEKSIDLVTSEYNITAKNAKDVAAFSVLLASIFSLVVGLVIFGSKIIDLLGGK